MANVLFSYFFYTPKMYRINRASRELVMKYRIMQDRLKASERKIAEIRHRDQSVYRALFSTDTLSLDGIYTEYPSGKYRPMADDSYSSLMIGTWKQMDALARQLYLESVSFDQLQILAKNKEKLSSAIPPRGRSTATSCATVSVPSACAATRSTAALHHAQGGSTWRATWATPSTPRATAWSKKVDLNRARHGYGTFVVVNHEFGYKTRYAHLNKVFVKPGDPVVRGQLIAEAGRTGGVTGPHLHYEVMYMGQVVNPINYFNKDMTGRRVQQQAHGGDARNNHGNRLTPCPTADT